MERFSEIWKGLADGAKLYVLRVLASPTNADKDTLELTLAALAERGAT